MERSSEVRCVARDQPFYWAHAARTQRQALQRTETLLQI